MPDDQSHPVERPDARTYFAAERTLLAWIRTGLAMMGFGFVVARFGLFLRELAAVSEQPARSHSGVSLWMGTGLVLFGVIVTICASVKHHNTLCRLEQGQPLRFSRWSMGIVVGCLLGMVGVLMTVYLLWGLNR